MFAYAGNKRRHDRFFLLFPPNRIFCCIQTAFFFEARQFHAPTDDDVEKALHFDFVLAFYKEQNAYSASSFVPVFFFSLSATWDGSFDAKVA